MSGIGVANNFDIQSTKVIDNRCAGPSTDTNSLSYKAPGLLRYETDNDEWKYYDGTNFVDLISAGVTYTGGTGVSISPSNEISIGQDVETTSDVTFNSVITNLIESQENGNLEIATNTGGTVNTRVTITNTGRVGINVAANDIEEDFEIDGNIQLDTGGAQRSRVIFYDKQNDHEHAEVDGLGEGTNGGVLAFYTKIDGSSVTEKMRITNDGKVGIGTSSPGSLLDINGTSNFRDLVNLDGLKVEKRTDMVIGNPASVLYPTADNTTNLMIGYESNTERISWKSIFLQARQNITLTAYNETFGIPISETRITLANTGTESLDTITYTAPGGHNFWKTNSGQNGTIYSGDIFLKQNGVISTNTYAQLQAVPSGTNGGKLNINVKDSNGNFATSLYIDPVSGLNTTRIVNLGELVNGGDITCSDITCGDIIHDTLSTTSLKTRTKEYSFNLPYTNSWATFATISRNFNTNNWRSCMVEFCVAYSTSNGGGSGGGSYAGNFRYSFASGTRTVYPFGISTLYNNGGYVAFQFSALNTSGQAGGVQVRMRNYRGITQSVVVSMKITSLDYFDMT